MSRDCIRVSESIWNSVREGIELTEAELRHVRTCESCAAELEQAQASLAALDCARAYPPAPDCRSAVMARISRRRGVFSPAWGYALAVVVVLIVIGGALLRSGGGRPLPPTDRNLAGAPTHIVPQPPLAPEPRPEVLPKEPEAPLVARKPEVRRSTVRGYASAPRKRRMRRPDSVTPNAPPRAREDAPTAAAPPDGESSALAYVTWSTGGQPTDSYRYSYSVTDPATGEVTKCSVRREGSAVEIKMESETAKPEAKPAKESKIDEAVRCG